MESSFYILVSISGSVNSQKLTVASLLQPLKVTFNFFQVFLLKNYFVILIVILSILFFDCATGACGVLVPPTRVEPALLQWKHKSQPLDGQGSPLTFISELSLGQYVGEPGPRTPTRPVGWIQDLLRPFLALFPWISVSFTRN